MLVLRSVGTSRWGEARGPILERGDYSSRKASSAASQTGCDPKFERLTPTSRTPCGGGKTDRIRSSATSRNLTLGSIAVSMDRLRVDIWKFDHLILTVTVRPHRCFAPAPNFVGHRDHARFDPSRVGQVLREGRLEPDDFRSRSGRTARSSRPRAIS